VALLLLRMPGLMLGAAWPALQGLLCMMLEPKRIQAVKQLQHDVTQEATTAAAFTGNYQYAMQMFMLPTHHSSAPYLEVSAAEERAAESAQPDGPMALW
jgi:hypothetical protein